MKKRGTKGTVFLGVLCICLSLLLAAGTAEATSIALSEFIFDWNSLTITAGGDLSLTPGWSAFMDEAFAKANNNLGAESNESGYHPVALVPGAYAEGWSPGSGSANVGGQVAIGATSPGFSAGGETSTFFASTNKILSGFGPITISIDYTINQYLKTKYLGDSAQARAYGFLAIELSGEFAYDYIQGEAGNIFPNTVQDGNSWSNLGQVGTLNLSLDIDFSVFDTINFYTGTLVTAEATAAVPEPATMFLLGFGLVGLVGFRRKPKK